MGGCVKVGDGWCLLREVLGGGWGVISVMGCEWCVNSAKKRWLNCQRFGFSGHK